MLLAVLAGSSAAWYTAEIGAFDTLEGRNHPVLGPNGVYTFQNPFENDNIDACISMCVDTADCHGVVATSSDNMCYFRGGISATPEILDSQKTPDANARLIIIYGKHNESPSPPPPPPSPPPPPPPSPPPHPPWAPYEPKFAGAASAVLVLLPLAAAVAVLVFAFREVDFMREWGTATLAKAKDGTLFVEMLSAAQKCVAEAPTKCAECVSKLKDGCKDGCVAREKVAEPPAEEPPEPEEEAPASPTTYREYVYNRISPVRSVASRILNYAGATNEMV